LFIYTYIGLFIDDRMKVLNLETNVQS